MTKDKKYQPAQFCLNRGQIEKLAKMAAHFKEVAQKVKKVAEKATKVAKTVVVEKKATKKAAPKKAEQ